MSKNAKIVVAVVVGLIVVSGAAGWLLLRDDEPEAVSLDSAVEGVGESGGDDPVAATGDPGAIEGTWTVDASSGEFDFDTATGTFAGFRINETISIAPDTEAVGRTGDVSGSMTIAGDQLTEASFTVDLTSLTTNQSRRDSKVQEALETQTFPEATFLLTEPVTLPSGAADGSDVAISAVGDLTIHGVTQKVTFPLQAKLVESTVVVVGSLDLDFADYDVEVPTAPIILSVDDHGPLEVQLLMVRA